MKFLATTLALSLASVACVGSMGGSGESEPGNGSPGNGNPGNGSSGNGNPGNGSPGSGNNGGGKVDPPPVNVGMCTNDTLSKPRVWRLTHAQLKNSLRDNFGFAPPVIDSFPAEARIDQEASRNGFANRSDNLGVAPILADLYFQASEQFASDVAAKAADYGVGCPMAMLGAGNCLKDFVGKLGAKMWRRALTPAEVDKLAGLYTQAAGHGDGPEGGLKTTVQALFLSPHHIYRSELGDSTDGVTRLTDYELASALSFALWDTAPDAELMDLAGKGRLRDKDVLAAQAKRLLGSKEKTASALHHFMEQWLHTEDLTENPKDLEVFSMATPEVAADVVSETRKLVDSIMFEPGGDKSFKTLFTANYGFVNSRTAALYGVQGVSGDQLVKKEFDSKQRRGLLTQASFMWGHANPDGTHPVERGRFFREEVLCEGVPDPPPSVLKDPKFGDPSLTKREQLAAHLESGDSCAGCHKLIDGVGLAMENYDGIGRFRTEEVVAGGVRKPIDASGILPLPSGEELSFGNFIELVDKLATKPDVYSCFASQYMDYTAGRKPGDINKCERALVADQFAKSGYSLDQLVLSVVASPSFTARKN